MEDPPLLSERRNASVKSIWKMEEIEYKIVKMLITYQMLGKRGLAYNMHKFKHVNGDGKGKMKEKKKRIIKGMFERVVNFKFCF